MSTTMLSSSSSGRRNVASTTKVAPCSFWADPKTSPEQPWAIMMWSRTVTLNKISSFSVVDHVTESGKAAVGQARQDRGQLGERGPSADQRLEPVVAQQVEREGEPVGVGPAVIGPDAAHLAAAHGQPAGVEELTQGHLDLLVAVPAQLHDRALRGEQLQRALQPGRAGAGVDHQVAVAPGLVRTGEGHAQPRGELGASRIDVHELQTYPRKARQN